KTSDFLLFSFNFLIPKLLENGVARIVDWRAAELLDPEPAPGVGLVDRRQRILRSDLRAMTSERRQLASDPVPHVDGKCRRLGLEAERIGCDSPQAGGRRSPPFGVRSVHELAHRAFGHRHEVE